MEQQQLIATEGLSPRARNILLSPNPTAYSLMALKREELRKALRANNVPLKTVWRKKHLTLRVFAFLRERRAAMAAGAAPAGQDGQAGQVIQAPQPQGGHHQCMVCHDRPAELMFSICMHVGICQQCKVSLVSQHNQNHHHHYYPYYYHNPQNRRVQCPVCRRDHKIGEVKKFFTL